MYSCFIWQPRRLPTHNLQPQVEGAGGSPWSGLAGRYLPMGCNPRGVERPFCLKKIILSLPHHHHPQLCRCQWDWNPTRQLGFGFTFNLFIYFFFWAQTMHPTLWIYIYMMYSCACVILKRTLSPNMTSMPQMFSELIETHMCIK